MIFIYENFTQIKYFFYTFLYSSEIQYKNRVKKVKARLRKLKKNRFRIISRRPDCQQLKNIGKFSLTNQRTLSFEFTSF